MKAGTLHCAHVHNLRPLAWEASLMGRMHAATFVRLAAVQWHASAVCTSPCLCLWLPDAWRAVGGSFVCGRFLCV